MKNFTLCFKATLTFLVLFGGVLFAGSVQAQSLLTTTIVQKGIWLGANEAVDVLSQEISTHEASLTSLNGHDAELALVRITYYEYIREEILGGVQVGLSVAKSYEKILGELQIDSNGAGITVAEMEAMYVDSVNLLSI